MKNVQTGLVKARWTLRKVAHLALRYWALPTLFMGLCAVNAQIQTPNGGIRSFAENFSLGASVVAGQSRVIFYRPHNAPGQGAMTVLVNGQ